MNNNATIIALSGKGGVGKTSISAAIVKLLVEAYPDKKILAIAAGIQLAVAKRCFEKRNLL